MKKLILFLLTATLLILPLSGCLADNKQNAGTTPNNTTENTTPESTTPEETTPEATTPEVTTPPENDQNDPPMVEGELDKNHPLIVAIREYIDDRDVCGDFIVYSFATKIDFIKSGERQALHVAFDPDDHYFVCGYYSSAHEFESSNSCCIEEYTWKQYEDESEIQEHYKDMKCMLVFQINRALTVTDIMSNETEVPDIQHFQFYDPAFENGVNIGAPLTFDETFVYLNNSKDDTIYYYTTVYNHINQTIPCVYLDGQYYISFYLDTLKADHSFNAQDVLSRDYVYMVDEFAEYYDAIIGVMDTEKYHVNAPLNGYVYYYGVITLEDFVNEIIA